MRPRNSVRMDVHGYAMHEQRFALHQPHLPPARVSHQLSAATANKAGLPTFFLSFDLDVTRHAVVRKSANKCRHINLLRRLATKPGEIHGLERPFRAFVGGPVMNPGRREKRSFSLALGYARAPLRGLPCKPVRMLLRGLPCKPVRMLLRGLPCKPVGCSFWVCRVNPLDAPSGFACRDVCVSAWGKPHPTLAGAPLRGLPMRARLLRAGRFGCRRSRLRRRVRLLR